MENKTDYASRRKNTVNTGVDQKHKTDLSGCFPTWLNVCETEAFKKNLTFQDLSVSLRTTRFNIKKFDAVLALR